MPENNKGKRLKIGGILLILFSLMYLPSLFHWLSNDNIGTGILRLGTIEKAVNAEGLLIRDEVLLEPSASNGKFIPEAVEGERVPAFSSVATISGKTSLGLLKDLEEINAQIIQAQNEIAKKTDFFSEDMARIDKSIGQKVRNIISQCNNNSMAEMDKLTLEVDKLIEKKAAIAGEDGEDSHIKTLKQEKSNIQQQINSNTSQVTSQYSGIVSYVIDGYEETLTPESIKELTPEIIKSISDNKISSLSGYEEVVAGKPFMKVIRGNDTYIITILEKEKAGMFKAGEAISVRLNAIGAVISGLVYDISEKSEGAILLTVRIDRYTEELSSMRKINVDLIKKSPDNEGLKVPVKCLYSPDPEWKTAKLMLIKSNCATERQVAVVCKDEEYAIIRTPDNEVKKTIGLYDTYVLNPENIKEGQIILK